MATGGGDDSAQLLSCVVCLEEYEEDGEHVPRLLPCTHTACERCIKGLIRNNTLVCPVCRKKHRAENKAKSFSQNMYILNHIHDKKNQPKEKQRCEKHGKELGLYCMNDECEKAICTTCLRADHEGHNWMEIEEWEKRAFFIKEVKKGKLYLEAKVERASKMKEDVDQCVKELKEIKENVVKRIDEMIEDADSQRKQIHLKADTGVSNMKNNIQRLKTGK